MTLRPALAVLLSLAAARALAQAPVDLGLQGPIPARAEERVVAFRIAGAGQVTDVRDWPPGWSLALTNDSNCTFSVRAEIVVGAAALEMPGDLPRLRHVLRVTPCGAPVAPRISVTLARPGADGREERRSLDLSAALPRR